MKIEKKEITPVCPHCEQRVDHLIVVKSGWITDHQVYCCPECEKIVGMTYNLP